MKRPLNTRRLLPVILLLVLVLVCGTVYAYMFMRTDEKGTTFTPAEVSCTVSETFDGTAKSSITVKNTGNIDAYLRVRLVTYWVNEGGKVAAKNPLPTLGITLADGWVAGSDNTFYYESPIKSGESTNLLKTGSSIALKQSDEGYLQVIDVFAEAIQAKPTTAVESSWKVTVTAGKITGTS